MIKNLNDQNTYFPYDSQLHVLRHFEFVDNDYLKSLSKEINKTPDELEKLILLAGSKFFYSFATNPISLLEIVSKNISPDKLIFLSNRAELSYLYDKKDYPDGIGVDNLISLSDLTKQKQESIEAESRDNYEIKWIHQKEKVPTWQINIILRKEEDKYIILTIFPGILAPPFPNPLLQKKEELDRNDFFWKNHAFIK